jgi:hypothetical protein
MAARQHRKRTGAEAREEARGGVRGKNEKNAAIVRDAGSLCQKKRRTRYISALRVKVVLLRRHPQSELEQAKGPV